MAQVLCTIKAFLHTCTIEQIYILRPFWGEAFPLTAFPRGLR